MLAPAEVGWDLALYAQEWLQERFRITLKLTGDVAKKASTRAVHDLRVACRRLREAINFFHGVAEVPPLSDIDSAARRMARAVQLLRETDVAIKRLSRLHVETRGEKDPTKEELGKALAKRRRKVARKKEKRIEKRAKELERAIKDHLPLRVRPRAADVDPARETELRAFVEVRVASRRAEVERLFGLLHARGARAASEPGSDRLHAIRVAIKHWRYASEIARAVMPRVLYRPMAARLTHLQNLGGKSQDFADLSNAVEREIGRRGKHGHRRILSVLRSERARAAREFYDALKALVPPSRAANGA